MRRHLLFGVQGPNKGAAGPARSPTQPSSTVPWGATCAAKLIAICFNTATRKRRSLMAESARDRYAEMAMQGYDANVIREAPEAEPGDTDPSLVEVQNFLKHYGYLDYAAVARNETPATGRLD